MDLSQIAAALGQHNYLALVLLGAVYLRTLFGDESKFPVTWDPNLRPLFVGVASAVVMAVTARDNGQSWTLAAGSAVMGLCTGGFLDGMIVAIFGTTAKAPTWARWLVAAVDDVFAGKTTTKVIEATVKETTLVSAAPVGSPKNLTSEAVTPAEGTRSTKPPAK